MRLYFHSYRSCEYILLLEKYAYILAIEVALWQWGQHRPGRLGFVWPSGLPHVEETP